MSRWLSPARSVRASRCTSGDRSVFRKRWAVDPYAADPRRLRVVRQGTISRTSTPTRRHSNTHGVLLTAGLIFIRSQSMPPMCPRALSRLQDHFFRFSPFSALRGPCHPSGCRGLPAGDRNIRDNTADTLVDAQFPGSSFSYALFSTLLSAFPVVKVVMDLSGSHRAGGQPL